MELELSHTYSSELSISNDETLSSIALAVRQLFEKSSEQLNFELDIGNDR
jgi:hypothetical protein